MLLAVIATPTGEASSIPCSLSRSRPRASEDCRKASVASSTFRAICWFRRNKEPMNKVNSPVVPEPPSSPASGTP